MAKRLIFPDKKTPDDPARTRFLGFVPGHGLAAARAALDAVEGPPLVVRQGGGIAALMQPEPPGTLSGRGRAEMLAGLLTVQRRLEIACQAGPVLPVDPAVACCPTASVPALLDAAWVALDDALARHGGRRQWDVVLRWPPELVLARRREEIARHAAGLGRAGLAEAVAAALRAERSEREASLVAALTPAVLAFAPGGAAGAETEVALTVLLTSDGEAALEVALQGLAPEHAAGASVDLRGPLPPLSFTPVRIADVEAADIVRAWRGLDLPARIDVGELHRQWRRRAFALHPDRHAAGEAESFAAALSEATQAYHLLRDFLRDDVMRDGSAAEWTLDDVSRRAGPRLVLPAELDAGAAPAPAPAPAPAAEPRLETPRLETRQLETPQLETRPLETLQ